MQYYLATQLNKEDRDYIRDFYRELGKLKNVLDFPHLESLNFRYKFLGDEFSADAQLELKSKLVNLVNAMKLQPFAIETTPLRLGVKAETQNDKVVIKAKNTPEFKQFVNLLNKLTYETLPDTVIRRKDNPELIGKLNVLYVPKKISRQQGAILRQVVKDYPKINTLTVDNLCFVQQSFNQSKRYIKILDRINF
jgi:hypothetical protein